MTDHKTTIDLLKSGQEIIYDHIDSPIASAVKNKRSVRIAPLQKNEPIKPGQVVLQVFAGQTRLRIVEKTTGDSCQLKNARGLIEGWVLKTTILGVLRDDAPAGAT